jgi:hypothetical protein
MINNIQDEGKIKKATDCLFVNEDKVRMIQTFVTYTKSFIMRTLLDNLIHLDQNIIHKVT